MSSNADEEFVTYKEEKKVKKRFFDSENGLAAVGLGMIVLFILFFIWQTLSR